MTAPMITTVQRADGFWMAQVGGFARAELFATEEAARKAAEKFVEKNWKGEKK